MRLIVWSLLLSFPFLTPKAEASLLKQLRVAIGMDEACKASLGTADSLTENDNKLKEILGMPSEEALEADESLSDADVFAPPLPIDIDLPKTKQEWLTRPYGLRVKIMGYLKGEQFGAALHKDFYYARVKYLNEIERQKYIVRVREGRLVDSQGELLCPKKCRGIFVMSPAGEIYFTDEQKFRVFHHSSFLAGAEVAAAGELKIKNGYLLSVNNRSGHYRPNYAHVFQFLMELKDLGVKTDYKIEFYDLTGKYIYDYRKEKIDKPLRKASLKKVANRPGWARRHIGPLPWEVLTENEPESL